MKKMKCTIAVLMVGLLLLGGCGKAVKRAQVADKQESSESYEESSSSSSSSSTEETIDSEEEEEATSDNTNAHMFKLMIAFAQMQISSMQEEYSDTFSSITITEGDDYTVVYTYSLVEPLYNVDATAVEELKEILVEELRTEGFKEKLEYVSKAISNIKFQFIFLNPDGSEAVNFTATSEEIDSSGSIA